MSVHASASAAAPPGLAGTAGPRPLFQLPFPCGVNTPRVVGYYTPALVHLVRHLGDVDTGEVARC
jgi:hypothetical protein